MCLVRKVSRFNSPQVVTTCMYCSPLHAVYKDTSTPSPFIEQFTNDDGCAARSAKPDHIYMDCMGFGMGCSCLQVTFQACDIEEARHLYDQLAVVCPVMVSKCIFILEFLLF